ncbi:MAG: Thymidylate synthase [Myxococcaceae bacterium]|nr:Thymidylate synthase [Myxococcaceae bacterium]
MPIENAPPALYGFRVEQYHQLVRQVLDEGERRDDRTGTGTLSIFGAMSRYDLRHGFPLLTTKKVLWTGVVRELLWFLRGSTNIQDDLKQHTPIWDAWADERGELGPIYGHQWRSWGAPFVQHAGDQHRVNPPRVGAGIDQLQQAIDTIKRDPSSRRIIVSAWNVADIPHMALPPCHAFFQFYVHRGRLDLQLYQRSADIGLGVPFNVASYALLLMLVAQECDLTPGVLVHTLGDAHIYLNHVEGLKLQLTREPYPLPRVEIAKKPLADIRFEDIQLLDYQHHPFIKLAVSV